jgi:hypothetical protein
MIAELQSGGDTRDGRDINKINEIIRALNQSATSSHPQFVHIERNDGGLVFDFSGLVSAISIAIGKQI